MDRFSPKLRSKVMSRIKGKNTKPELIVRRFLHRLGYRYTLHRKELPGTPDLVFPARRKVILVHGCFWHHHNACKDGRVPKSRVDYWSLKLRRNVERDRGSVRRLRRLGWRVLTVWECETDNLDLLSMRLLRFLGGS
jgi:DNA mismatch endonuclease (patch repair protein)